MTEPSPYPVPAPVPPAPAKRKRWPWILGLVGTLILGIIIGSASSGATPAPTAAAGKTTVTVTAPAAPAVATSSAPAPPAAPPASSSAPAAAGPATSFGDGMYLVGTDVAVGAYKSAGPRAGGPGECYWARLKDDSGQNIIANNLGAGATRVTVKKGEYLQVTGCDFVKA